MAVFVTCSCTPAPPSRLEIARAIRSSGSFQDVRWVSLRSRALGACAEAIQVDQEWSRWKALGLIETSDLLTSAGKMCQISLSEETRREAQNLHHQSSGDGRNDAEAAQIRIPIAIRNFIRTVAIRQTSSETAEVDFEWQWRPNRIGERLLDIQTNHAGWARLASDERGWHVMAIRLDN